MKSIAGDLVIHPRHDAFLQSIQSAEHHPHATPPPNFTHRRLTAVPPLVVHQVIRWETFSSDFGPKDGIGSPQFWEEYARYVFTYMLLVLGCDPADFVVVSMFLVFSIVRAHFFAAS